MTRRPEPLHVPIWRRTSGDRVFFRLDGAPPEVDTFDLLELPWPSCRVTVVDSARPPLAPRARKIRALEAGEGQFVVRRSRIEPAVRDVPSEELVLRPVALVDRRGKLLDDDFVYLDVRTMVPLDRGASEVSWTVPSSPASSFATDIHAVAWSRDRTPRPRIFRVGEARRCVVADTALVAALERATGGDITRLKPPLPKKFISVVPNEYDFDRLSKIDVSRGDAVAAEEAFWAMYRSGPDDALRTAACQNPIYAFWVALLVDKKPADDTRVAASRHSFYAAMYAQHVDRGRHDVTERGAMTGALGAALYASYVTREFTPGAQKAICHKGWTAEDIATLRREIDVLRAFYAGAPIPSAPPVPEAEPEPQALAPYPPRTRFATRDKKPSVQSHAALSPAQQTELDALIHEGRALVGVPDDAHASRVAQALRAYVDNLQLGVTRLARGKGPRVRAALAAAWGEALGDALGWQWALLRTAKSGPRVPALVSPDRAYAHFPRDFVDRVTKGRTSSNPVMLVYNMVTGGGLPAPGKRKYVRVG